MARKQFKVVGMHCTSCEKILQMDIGDVNGVKSVKADFRAGSVVVEGEGFKEAEVRKAIVMSGYKVE